MYCVLCSHVFVCPCAFSTESVETHFCGGITSENTPRPLAAGVAACPKMDPLEVRLQKPVVSMFYWSRKSSSLIGITTPDPAPLAWWEIYQFALIVSDFNTWKYFVGMIWKHVRNWEEEILISLLQKIQGAASSLNSSLLLGEAHDCWVCDCVCAHSFLLLYFIHMFFFCGKC